MNKQEFNESLLGFLDASPTPFHVTRNMCGMLKNAGFTELNEKDGWELKKGCKYFVTRNDSSLIAFTYPHAKDYVMVGTHTDSPNLKLKPNPVIKEHGVVRFGVESYGGLLLTTWFDRDLSLAGRISYLNSKNIIKETLIDVKKPIATIPSLAIHLDDKANKDKTINKQTDLSPILTSQEDFDFDEFLKEQLMACGVDDVEKLYANELSFYDIQKASFVGLKDEFITSARIDNLISCYVGLLSICSIDDEKPMFFVANDHEEVGSDTTAGAGGSFLQDTLMRVFSDYEEYVQVIRSSVLISCDNAHALHPNYPSKHDSNHMPYINKGVVIKTNANQRYASNSKTIARFKNVADGISEPYQEFVSRSDMGCGSTIGPITATRLGIDTLDIGVPTWAMHSIREVCGSDDAHSLYKVLVHY
jgi:aspartyl aminopeptidase